MATGLAIQLQQEWRQAATTTPSVGTSISENRDA